MTNPCEIFYMTRAWSKEGVITFDNERSGTYSRHKIFLETYHGGDLHSTSHF